MTEKNVDKLKYLGLISLGVVLLGSLIGFIVTVKVLANDVDTLKTAVATVDTEVKKVKDNNISTCENVFYSKDSGIALETTVNNMNDKLDDIQDTQAGVENKVDTGFSKLVDAVNAVNVSLGRVDERLKNLESK